MIETVAKLLDWFATQSVALMKPADSMLHPRLDDAIEFLNGPEFIPAETSPAKIEFDADKGGIEFRFPSPLPSDAPENNTVYGRLFRCRKSWQHRPTVILLAGWNDSGTYKLRFPRIARACNRAGINAVTLVMPYHFQRRPRQRATFSNPDCLQLAHALSQGVSEIRVMISWLLAEGCQAVSLWGYSLGANYTALTISRDARVASAILACPSVLPRPWVEAGALSASVRKRLPHMLEVFNALHRTPMNALTTRPMISPRNILLIEGIYDSICRREDIDALWQTWGNTNIWRLPEGHVSICCGFVPGLSQKVVEWLTAHRG